MKKGEIVICKKDCFCNLINKNKPYFTAGKFYKIIDIGETIVFIMGDKYIKPLFLVEVNSLTYFHEYFYTKKELRKVKLEKINEGR